MKIAIFGATGKTGVLIVKAALREGHEVNAYVRDRAKLGIQHEKLHLIQGNLSDPQTIEKAILGTDAVISALSSGKGTLTVFGGLAIPIMRRLAIKRIVSLVGAGVSEEGDPSSFGRSIMLGLMNLIAKDVLSDATKHADQLRGSDLDWTLVRPPRLVDGAATGKIEHSEHLKLGPSRSITRADLANFMLKAATSSQYTQASPMVANLPPPK